MNLLLDTCALLALAEGNLPPAAGKALGTAELAILSPIVVWELAIKVASGKITLPIPPLEWANALAERHQLTRPSRGLDADLLCAAADLPLIHRDPFDRVLVATAFEHRLHILTSDRMIRQYPDVDVVWR